MESNSGSKPDLRLSPRARELLDLESRVTAGGFDPLPCFFFCFVFLKKGQGSLLWVSQMRGRKYEIHKFQL